MGSRLLIRAIRFVRTNWLLIVVYGAMVTVMAGYIVARTLDINESAQRLLWSFFEWAGWYWWGIAIAGSLIGLFYMSKLNSAKTDSGKITRLCHYVGFTCYLASWGNNALGGVAAMLILVGTVIMIRQQSIVCEEERHKNIPNDAKFGERVLRRLVDQ